MKYPLGLFKISFDNMASVNMSGCSLGILYETEN